MSVRFERLYNIQKNVVIFDKSFYIQEKWDLKNAVKFGKVWNFFDSGKSVILKK